jgi:hypothetical protein
MSLLQSCSSVRRVVERNEIYTLVCGKTLFLAIVCVFLPPTYQNHSVLLLGQLHNCFSGRSFLQTIKRMDDPILDQSKQTTS